MSSKTDAIKAKITELVTGREKTEQLLVELRRQEAWEAGQARRERVTAIGQQATELADLGKYAGSQLTAALNDVTKAVRRAHELADEFNGRLHGLKEKLRAEGVTTRMGGSIPPSPSDGHVAHTDDGIHVRDRRVHMVDSARLIEQAVAAAKDPDATAPNLHVTTPTPPLVGPFWRANSTGGVHEITNGTPHDCTPISRTEYLAATWGLNLKDLPADVLADLTDQDKARLAPSFMAEMDDDQRAEFASHLLPGKTEENTK